MPTYAIVKTGGKQYRVETGQTLLIEKLPVDQGATVALEPLLYRGDDAVVTDGDRLGEVSVKATVLGHERGKKIRVFKFKPKRGYKRTTGHRQSLTRIQIAEVALGGTTKPTRAKAAADEAAPKAASSRSTAAKASDAAAKPRAPRKPASSKPTYAGAPGQDAAAKPRAAHKPASAEPAGGKGEAAGGAPAAAAKPRAPRKPAAAKPAEGEATPAPKRTRKPAARKPPQGDQPTKPDGGDDGA